MFECSRVRVTFVSAFIYEISGFHLKTVFSALTMLSVCIQHSGRLRGFPRVPWNPPLRNVKRLLYLIISTVCMKIIIILFFCIDNLLNLPRITLSNLFITDSL